MLPMLADMVSGMLGEAETQLHSLHAAQKKPHVLDESMGILSSLYGDGDWLQTVFNRQSAAAVGDRT